MIRIILFLSIFCSPVYSQQMIYQALVREANGEIQYRNVNNPLWIPMSAGGQITERTFIRLNTPDSLLTLSLPDGSLLRFMGIGSFYLEYIGRAINNNYQTKLLNLTGRWFYNTDKQQTRFIVNTDITTSIIENGSGGGFYFNGTNDFVLRSGKGLIGYRQQNSQALVVDENQIVNFNIYDGFFQAKLATDEVYQQYLIFDRNPVPSTLVPEPIQDITIIDQVFSNMTPNSNTNDLLNNYNNIIPDTISYLPISYKSQQILSFDPIEEMTTQSPVQHSQEIFFTIDDQENLIQQLEYLYANKKITRKELDINQLQILKDFVYNERPELLQVVLGELQTIIPETPQVSAIRNTPTPVSRQLLDPINIEDFTIDERSPTPPPTIETESTPRVIPRPQPRRPQPISVRPEEIIERPVAPEEESETEDNIAAILSALQEQGARERQQQPQRQVQTPETSNQSLYEYEEKEIEIEKPKPQRPEPTPVVRVPTTPPSWFNQNTMENPNIVQMSDGTLVNNLYEEGDIRRTYKPPDSYYNRNLSDESYQFDAFSGAESEEELLHTEFASVLFGI